MRQVARRAPGRRLVGIFLDAEQRIDVDQRVAVNDLAGQQVGLAIRAGARAQIDHDRPLRPVEEAVGDLAQQARLPGNRVGDAARGRRRGLLHVSGEARLGRGQGLMGPCCLRLRQRRRGSAAIEPGQPGRRDRVDQDERHVARQMAREIMPQQGGEDAGGAQALVLPRAAGQGDDGRGVGPADARDLDDRLGPPVDLLRRVIGGDVQIGGAAGGQEMRPRGLAIG